MHVTHDRSPSVSFPKFSHDKEQASPGYYTRSIRLWDKGNLPNWEFVNIYFQRYVVQITIDPDMHKLGRPTKTQVWLTIQLLKDIECLRLGKDQRFYFVIKQNFKSFQIFKMI
jgi:hypothetical protein